MPSSERIRPPWWLKYVNKVMIGLNKLGVGGDKGPVVLTVPGRKTGKPRSTPVTPMTIDGHRYVVGGLPKGDWAANARAAGEATVHQGRREQRVRIARAERRGTVIGLIREAAVELRERAVDAKRGGREIGQRRIQACTPFLYP